MNVLVNYWMINGQSVADFLTLLAMWKDYRHKIHFFLVAYSMEIFYGFKMEKNGDISELTIVM